MAEKKPPASDPTKGKTSAPEPDLAAIAAGFVAEFSKLGKQFASTFEEFAEEAQYKFDQELAKALAKHPELYAEVRKTMRQAKKTMDKAAEAFGLKDQP
jgi:hypothetical protein